MSSIIVVGDLLDVDCGLIVHQVNLAGVMGAGLAKQVRDKYPYVFSEYVNSVSEMSLGDIHVVEIDGDLSVCNLAGQDRPGPNTSIAAHELAWEAVAYYATGRPVYAPWKIGCGIGGGDWNVVRSIAEKYVPGIIWVVLPNAAEDIEEPKLWNKADNPPDDVVYIGRGSDFGNPIKITENASRQVSVELYREYASEQLLSSDLAKIAGKDLWCYCSPKLCHGMVLLELAAEIDVVELAIGELDAVPVDPQDGLVVAVTGHRPQRLSGYSKDAYRRLVSAAETWLKLHGPKRVITGGALGWDMAVAAACVKLRIPYVVAVPFRGQEKRWSRDLQRRYELMLKHAAKVVVLAEVYSRQVMQARNEWMVDRCNTVLAVFDGSPGGTQNCLLYAAATGKPIINIYKEV